MYFIFPLNLCIIGLIEVNGIYNSSDSTYQIAIKAKAYYQNLLFYDFIHSSKFEFNEWVFIGISFFRRNRLEKEYDIHLVSKTYSGVENQDSFLSEKFYLACSPDNLFFDSSSNYNVYYSIGSYITDKKIKFTGI